MILPNLIRVAGVCQLSILFASAMVPKVLNWRTELRQLSPLSRHLVWTHGAFIVLVIIGFGLLSLGLAPDLAAGDPLARSLCAFVAIFWLTRLVIQFFVFDPRPYLKTKLLTVGFHALTVLFVYLAVVYAIAAVIPQYV